MTLLGRDDDPEHEGERERRDRQLLEMLNELRVALPGVQILFAFLLAVPFAQGWERTTAFQRDVFYLTLIATTISAACLIAPSAAHRLRFHRRDRVWLIESANAIVIAGLVALAVAITGAVLLITDLLFDGPRVWIYTAVVGAIITWLWFGRALLRRARGLSSGP